MTYKYRAYTPDKRIVQGTIDGTSESMAEVTLYRAGYQSILSLKKVHPGLSLETLIPTFFGIKTQDIIDFSRQLATLTESGIAIITALHLLEGQASKSAFKKVIAGLNEELRGGSSLSQALSKYPQAFSRTHCQVIRAGEKAGTLEAGLRQVADYLEKQAATTQRIKRALVYPAFVSLMAIAVTALLITVALPPVVKLFTSLGTDLPWMTRLLISSTGFLSNNALFLFGGLFILVMLMIGYLRLPAGKLVMDRLLVTIPAVGSINIERHSYLFCQTTSMLLKAGLHLPQTIDIVIQTIRNRIIRQALADVREKLLQGEGLSQPVAETALFPQLLVEMIVVGEKTGTLDTTLATLAGFYERRVDQKISIWISMIEPFLTVFIGLVVLFIALSMITPLYSILRSMH